MSWKTAEGDESVVEYGVDGGPLNRTASGSAQTLAANYRLHGVQLTGLQPETLYTYRVRTGSQVSPVFRFRTQPTAARKSGHFRILLTGDHQLRNDDRHTPLLQAAKAALPAHHAWLNDAMDEYVEEEMGHDEWILNDIRACGADAEAVRHGKPGHAAEVMVAYAYDMIARRNPLGFFGMVHVLEGTSVSLALLVVGLVGWGPRLHPTASATENVAQNEAIAKPRVLRHSRKKPG